MIQRVTVENYALIRHLDITLGSGLNIITGETGAGKSILLGALGLILGNRADSAALADNVSNCVVEAEFDLSGYGLEAFFEEQELEYDTPCIVRRVITPAGKSRAYVNDLPVQLTTLKELGLRLVDIHSQHRSLLVASEDFRREVVDNKYTSPHRTPSYLVTPRHTRPCKVLSESLPRLVPRLSATVPTRSGCAISGSNYRPPHCERESWQSLSSDRASLPTARR